MRVYTSDPDTSQNADDAPRLIQIFPTREDWQDMPPPQSLLLLQSAEQYPLLPASVLQNPPPPPQSLLRLQRLPQGVLLDVDDLLLELVLLDELRDDRQELAADEEPEEP